MSDRYVGSLEVGEKSHVRNYRSGVRTTSLMSAKSPFSNARKRLKSIMPEDVPEFFKRIFSMRVKTPSGRDELDIYVDSYTGEQVLNIIPSIYTPFEKPEGFTLITGEEFVVLFFALVFSTFEERTFELDGNVMLWKMFYGLPDCDYGVAISSVDGKPLFAKFTAGTTKFP